MACTLPTDCLNEIFELLDDKVDLYSCLLVNRHWCEVSVRILWTNIRNFNTLLNCLPNETKEMLSKSKIIKFTQKPPLFNYVTFIKNLNIYDIGGHIQSIGRCGIRHSVTIAGEEIFKMLMKQISLKTLNFHYHYFTTTLYIPFLTYPGTMDCLKNLSKLKCRSDVLSESFCQLSQICHDIRSLSI